MYSLRFIQYKDISIITLSPISRVYQELITSSLNGKSTNLTRMSSTSSSRYWSFCCDYWLTKYTIIFIFHYIHN
ncbi:hypothetical protein HanIR_Chr08g0384291 [Helianthus annuus]|nr:hypothetical protein HanIR_Chr08g0384291 [Helianthus annuus]